MCTRWIVFFVKQKTAYEMRISDWSSDVCSSDLEGSVDGRIRMAELVCDGVLVATPPGSTAYNLSAQGPILPLDSKLLALTPISPFRPRRWRGALLPDTDSIELRVLEPSKRPVSAVADQHEVRDDAAARISADPATTLDRKRVV